MYNFQVSYGKGLESEPLAAMISNSTLTGLYRNNTTTLGIDMEHTPTNAKPLNASTDMGNLSRVVPSIHPNFYIGGEGVNNTRDFIKDSGKVK